MMNLEPDYTPRATIRRMLMLLVAALVLALGMATRADSVQLFDEVGVTGEQVTLKDVAKLEGPAAIKHGDLVLMSLNQQRGEYTVTLDTVEDALTKADVNWGLVSLRGYNECRVTRLIEPESMGPEAGQAVAANIETPIGLQTSLTLRARVEQHLAEHVGLHADELRIGFSERDAKKLDLPILGRSIEIEPTSQNTLGRVPLKIRLYEGRQVSESLHVNASVQRVMLAVVTTGPVTRGQTYTRDDLQVRECVIDNDDITPITDPALAIGQQATASLRGGDILAVRSVRPPVLVKRGELVEVRCFVGGLVIRTVGIAKEDGTLDSAIRIRSESSSDTFLATVTGRREAVVSIGHDPEPEATTVMADNTTQEVIR